jgi:exonuclease III
VKTSILFLNIQCLRNKIQELEDILEINKFDILCFEEHWLVESEANCFKVGSYSIAEYFARKNHIHGGVIQFVDSSFEYIPLPTVKDLSVEIDCELGRTFIPSI